MQVVGHDDEFMQQIFSRIPIMRKRFDQKVGSRVAPEDWLTLGGNGGDEEQAIEIHLRMLAQAAESCM